jgi:hypothetical protein
MIHFGFVSFTVAAATVLIQFLTYTSYLLHYYVGYVLLAADS